MKNIALLGATGSIGMNTVDVVLANPDKFRVLSFTFHNNLKLARKLIIQLQPVFVGTGTEEQALILAKEFPTIEFEVGVAGLTTAATIESVDIVLTAVSGSIGLIPTLKAIEKGKTIALANKETLVMGGEIVMESARQHNSLILPVDSEHSAIFQCLAGQQSADIDHLLITASGGSFRDYTRQNLTKVTLAEALSHPNWAMGKKITIDSSTMVNKGLEVIEAHWLFAMDYAKIKVVLHRESIVHSMVVMKDGAYLAQLGPSDMREPIQYALTYPKRLPIHHAKEFDLTELSGLHFEKMDFERFPMLKLAYKVGRQGGYYPTVFNAANEVAVAAFLAGKIQYLEIENLITKAVDAFKENSTIVSLTGLTEVDKETRHKVELYLEGK